MKKNLGKKNWMFPMPVLMIGTYGEDETPDVMNAAWGGITLEDEITICIDTSHKTWENIAARKAFTVAFGTADKVAACDYLGLVSGNKTPDKVSKSGLTVTKSKFVDAPVINELRLSLECEVVHTVTVGSHTQITGEVKRILADESILSGNGRILLDRLNPLIYDEEQGQYWTLDKKAADAFRPGIAFKKTLAKDPEQA